MKNYMNEALEAAIFRAEEYKARKNPYVAVLYKDGEGAICSLSKRGTKKKHDDGWTVYKTF